MPEESKSIAKQDVDVTYQHVLPNRGPVIEQADGMFLLDIGDGKEELGQNEFEEHKGWPCTFSSEIHAFRGTSTDALHRLFLSRNHQTIPTIPLTGPRRRRICFSWPSASLGFKQISKPQLEFRL